MVKESVVSAVKLMKGKSGVTLHSTPKCFQSGSASIESISPGASPKLISLRQNSFPLMVEVFIDRTYLGCLPNNRVQASMPSAMAAANPAAIVP